VTWRGQDLVCYDLLKEYLGSQCQQHIGGKQKVWACEVRLSLEPSLCQDLVLYLCNAAAFQIRFQ
jgi:hypothetical protein